MRWLRGVSATRRAWAGLVVAAAVVAIAGCGGSSGGGSGEASKSPQAILRDAAAALRRAHSFEATGRVLLTGKTGSVTVAEDAGALRFNLGAPGGATARLILVGGAAYLNANRAFYLQQGGSGAAAAALVAGKWLKLPSSVPGLSSLTGQFKLSTLSRCLAVGHGTLRNGGKATVDGHAAVVVVDAGDKPGTTPREAVRGDRAAPPSRCGSRAPARHVRAASPIPSARARAGSTTRAPT